MKSQQYMQFSHQQRSRNEDTERSGTVLKYTAVLVEKSAP